MKLLLSILITLLAAIAIGSFAQTDSGYMMLTLAGWTIQTSVSFFIIVLMVSFILLYVTVRIIVRFLLLPKQLKTWQAFRRQRYTEKYLTRGLSYMTEGAWKKAERDFCKAASYSNTPHISYLLAARAVQTGGAIDKRDAYLKLAAEHNPEANLAIGITQAELQLDQRQTMQALTTLKALQAKAPHQTQVKQLLLAAYTHLSDWKAILHLIPTIKKTGLYSKEHMQSKQLKAYAELLKKTAAAKDKAKLAAVWSQIPRKLRQHVYLIEVYVTESLHCDDTQDCEQLLKSALKRDWDSGLVRLYGLITPANPAKQLALAEAYLKHHADDAALLLSLGRICKRNQLWGKAKDYLQQSIDAQANPEAYYEYAQLHEQDGDDKAALACYQSGLKLVTNK